MQKLFVYGTLQKAKVQKAVIGRIAKPSPDKLRGFTRDKIDINGKTYPIAVVSNSSFIDGAVLEVNDSELPKLDKYETDNYMRVEVRLESGKKAWVYTKSQS